MVQRILIDSGFDNRPVHIGILDKGQRSVKGLNSGSESVATLDLVVTVQKPEARASIVNVEAAKSVTMSELMQDTLVSIDVRSHPTASHVYLTILKHAFAAGLNVEALHLSDILTALRERGLSANSKSGLLEAA
jgi:hypothetical protein